MTAKEKAEQLTNKFYSKTDQERVLVNKYWSSAKYCATVAVEEVLFALKMDINDPTSASVTYWQKVKQEIEKL